MKRFIVSAYSPKWDGGLMVLPAESLEDAFTKYCDANHLTHKRVNAPLPKEAPTPVAKGLDDHDVFGEEEPPFHIGCFPKANFTWQELYDGDVRDVYYLSGQELVEGLNLEETVQW